MTVRPCVPYPHALLKVPAVPVDEITPAVREIWQDMIDTMDAMPGYGLAAVQIGLNLRLVVVDCSEARGQAVLMANPEILHASGQFREHEEASPNLPGVSAVLDAAARRHALNELGWDSVARRILERSGESVAC